MPSVVARAVWAPKLGNRPDEWEDGCVLSESRGRFAVTDGASSSYLAGDWARRIAATFVTHGPPRVEPEAMDEWIAAIAEPYEAALAEESGEAESSAWYVSEAAARGSFCTYVGLEVRGGEHGLRWRASAIGDSCFFHLREGALVRSFPLSDPGEFGSTPHLVSSLPRDDSNGGRWLRSTTGEAIPGDIFLLTTDAVAEWALGSRFPGTWTLLATLPSKHLRQLVDDLRVSEEMVNDDVTIVRCRVEV